MITNIWTSRRGKILASRGTCFMLLMLFSEYPGSAAAVDHQLQLIQLGTMHEQRASHTATLLLNGKVLIAGGFRKGADGYSQVYFKSAELYDPKTRTFTPTGDMTEPRCGHTATLLQNGKVLIGGGYGNGALASAEIYDPATGGFTTTGTMSRAREGLTATLLLDGTVLIAGGAHDDQTSAELYVTRTGIFEPTGSLGTDRVGHTASLLPDGRVLIAGGAKKDRTVCSSCELYDPRLRTFTTTGEMISKRYKHGALTLSNGDVLILGGSDSRDWRGKYKSAEIYRTTVGSFSPISDMGSERFKLPHAMAVLKDGNILISGGSRQIEMYDTKKGSFFSVARFEEPHYYSTATLLDDGNVLLAGGYNDTPQSTNMAWLVSK